jgi:hypothetical protein
MMYLTNLLSFLHETEEGQYSDYLVSKGFQAASYTTRVKGRTQPENDDLFARFSVFFQEFFDKFCAALPT